MGKLINVKCALKLKSAVTAGLGRLSAHASDKYQAFCIQNTKRYSVNKITMELL